MLKRMVVATSLVSALLLLAQGSLDASSPAQGRGRGRGQDQGQGQDQGRGQGRGRGQSAQSKRLSQPDQDRRISEQRQRLTQYAGQLDEQQRQASQRGAQLRQQKRTSQFNFQQRYDTRLNTQRLGLRNSNNYNYGRDPYFYSPPTYRYSRGGRSFETNDRGATALRQAVNYGYEQGYGSGVADRQDRWTFNFQDSYPYQDANYGYGGFYIDRDDYNYYFREGFRRGYDDGYYRRSQYGVRTSGRATVIGSVVALILGLQHIR